MINIFLLGGYDLEMIAIKSLLSQYHQLFFDRHLSWHTAQLNAYEAELCKYGNKNEYAIYGIELQTSLERKLPSNYCLIDHHNEYSNKPSSLIQVAEILNHPLNRNEQLIAANDSAYIPGMEAFGATQEEIAMIRYNDRKAQGVTSEEEKLAQKAIQNKNQVNELTVIQTSLTRFSPICDRLYPFSQLLIYSDNEWVYYGNQQTKIIQWCNKELKPNSFFYGGGENGFIGIVSHHYSPEEIIKMKEKIINLST